MFGNLSVPLVIGVHSVVCAWSLAVNSDPEANCLTVRRWPKDKTHVSRMKAKHDAAARGVEVGRLCSIRPRTGKSPLIQFQVRGYRIYIGPILL